jgi:hypothetical protein
MSKWEDDKKWSDRFLPEIKCHLGMNLIGEPSKEEDMLHNTDLIVLKMDTVRIGCRVRRFSYIEKYRYEFTLRTKRPNKVKTEFDKIMESWGNYLFYGFSDIEEKNLEAWVMIDLNIFRSWIMTYMNEHMGLLPGDEKPNRDGSSEFCSFRLSDGPDKLVFASSYG